MHVAIIGAGPTGLFLGAALARRGHRVTAVDRDAGPDPDGGWARRGVMQFHHAHGFRPQVGEALRAELPEAHGRWVAAGAEPITFTLDDGRTLPGGMRSRRETFERALRAAVVGTPGLDLRRGHVDGVVLDGSRARGLRVDGVELRADLVIDASGRSGRATRDLRAAPALSGHAGVAYVDRQYRLLPGADPGPMTNPLAWQAEFDGYQVIVFRHEQGIFSVLIVRPTADPRLALLRHGPAFEAACRAIPGLDTWTDPERAEPITPVLVGGALVNHYRGQAAPDGSVRPNFVAVGDAVATTTPMFGRGITTSLLQARELLRRLDDGADPADVAVGFDAWCETAMRPWVADHVRMDAAMLDRWAGHDIDLDQRLPSDLVMAAAAVEPAIRPALPPYLAMLAGPECLDAVEPLAAAVYRGGWRPPRDEGPSRDELVAVLRGAPVPA
ncbi:NAD(P)/FAD-dependent oxidoreductase [Actinomycetospora sp. TBRC 11914]|uniref:FAD-dependent oxidoreductase n=1 Tax=Actinomycetospora sp. TBRC 11914 TaxID=2729387 RepID=UPI00145FAC93|nr:FAD-dependent monooxygenase [Actinomycetospora sp. TBRC 11914]NMO92669.1 NAD(P)-binding protein [Actinomycetospora sp. TBRC 11914]